MKRIAIIGAGYTGLSMAKRILETNKEQFEITIFEKENEPGGIVRTIPALNTSLDRHYRHIFKSDKYVIELAKELGIDLIWPETKMGYFTHDKVYEFGTPISLLKFKPLRFFDKIKFGLGIINLKLNKNWENFEKITAEEYIIKHCGEAVYKTVWEPLLISKFGKKKNQISMAWLWGKIALRSSSTSFKGEKLGYIKGSYKLLTDGIYKYLLDNNCKFKLGTEVIKVEKNNERFSIVAEGLEKQELFDAVISTTSNVITKKIYNDCLTDKDRNSLLQLEYSLAKTLIILSKKPLSKFYWINIGQSDVPFGGIIEQTNLLPSNNYQDLHVIYISNYMYEDDKLYKLSKEELLKEYMPSLQKINSNFTENDIKEVILCEDKYAQPIIKTKYSEQKCNYKFTTKGLYMVNMSQIYPEDRGMNYAIRLGIEKGDQIIEEMGGKLE